ncbi:hypothetical protein CFB40_17880 [Burkholderia sp. AU31652]|uniref:hypothetical protein n=1 Tax=Burkholderia TaxID=32008 RepID=UPI000B7A4B88|nr:MULTISPECIES: hypothetical protein [Burkholderia]MDN7491699.1 hypothetical protein [Burkholderia sp. AU45274]OXI83013.1 hypothetical protein CFB40_17880 [Burkholderia sp. AU31652]OXJ11094.1 hypothetical protein CFB45_29965 [Burkholderia sp. HI2500]
MKRKATVRSRICFRRAIWALSNDERTRGLALLCCSKARCDLEIDVREIAGVPREPGVDGRLCAV